MDLPEEWSGDEAGGFFRSSIPFRLSSAAGAFDFGIKQNPDLVLP